MANNIKHYDTFPPFVTYLLCFRFIGPTERRFSHTVFVNGLLNRLIFHPLPSIHSKPIPPWIVIPNPVESGRVNYRAGELYHIGVTFIGQGFPEFEMFRRTIATRLYGDDSPDISGEMHNIRLEDVVPVIPPNIDEQAEILHDMDRLTLQFVTPLQIEQKFRDGTSRQFDRDYFDPAHFFKTLNRRMYDISKLGPVDPGPLEDKEPPDITMVSNDLLWLRVPSPGEKPDAPQYYGAVGKVLLERDFPAWEKDLVLGQYLHLGKNTNFGFGRYIIRELDPVRRGDVKPARDFLCAAGAKESIRTAWEAIRLKEGCTGIGGETLDNFSSDISVKIGSLSDGILNKTYSPSSLLGIVTEDSNGRPRALAIPTVTDRIAQRSAVHCIGPSIDRLLEDCTYAYRKGHSRFDAVSAIESAYRDGYRYTLRADIESFFDSVDWDRLYDKLEALFPSEPLIHLIMQWVKCPVTFRGKTINRTRGLPQGAPISPMLANLYLDEFDEEMEKLGFRFIRYADDFVILCKSAARAREALEAAKKSLTDLDLELNIKKTTITNFDHGFRYLGYLFWRSVVLESPASQQEDDVLAAKDDNPPNIPATTGWLAETDQTALKPLEKDPQSGRIDVSPLVSTPDEISDAEGKEPLYLDSPDIRVRYAQRMLLVQKSEKGDIREIPLDRLSHIIVAGWTRMTLPAVLEAAREGIPVFCTRRSGEMFAAVNPQSPDWMLWQAQANAINNNDLILDFSRQVVMAKLNNQAVILRGRDIEAVTDDIKSIRALEKACAHVGDIDELLGHEGRGAAFYFSAFGKLIGPEWNFSKRIKYPPTDPVNALLSFGYSMLYYRLSATLHIAGLNPALGLFHQPRGNYHALAADLQEEFRHLVDSLTLRMIRKREILSDDFVLPANRSGCFLRETARKKYIVALEERSKETFTPSGFSSPVSYRRFFEYQARQIRRLITGEIKQYKPLRIH